MWGEGNFFIISVFTLFPPLFPLSFQLWPQFFTHSPPPLFLLLIHTMAVEMKITPIGGHLEVLLELGWL